MRPAASAHSYDLMYGCLLRRRVTIMPPSGLRGHCIPMLHMYACRQMLIHTDIDQSLDDLVVHLLSEVFVLKV